MPVVKVQLPDGQVVNVQLDEPSAMDTVKAYGKSALRGPVLGAAWLLDKGPLGTGGGTVDMENLTPLLPGNRPEGPPANLAGPLTAGEKLRSWLNEKLPPEPGITHRVAEGVGAGAASRYPLRGALAGGVGTASAEGAGEFLKGFPEPVRQAGMTIAGMLGGGGTAALTAPHRKTTPMQDAERDSRILTDVGMNRAGPEVDPSKVANTTADAANKFVKETSRRNSEAYSTTVDGQTVRPSQVALIYTTLKGYAKKQQSPEAAAAYNDVADSLVKQGGTSFITDLQTLSGQLKRFKDAPVGDTASAARKWSSQDIAAPVREAEDLLRAVAPAYDAANNTYAWGRKNLVDPLKEGPIGKMADRNPNVATPTPVSRMEGLVQNRGEGDIVSTMLALKASGANPEEIARALMQARNRSGGARPGQIIFGGEGSPMEAEMSALLMSGGKDPAAVQAPFRAADQAANAAKVPQGEKTFGTVQIIPNQRMSLRALATPEWLKGNPEKAQYTEAITKLLRSASPGEVDQLMKLAQFDPKIRIALTLSGIAVPEAITEGK